MSVTNPHRAATLGRRGVILALVATATYLAAACAGPVGGPAAQKPPRLNGSVTQLNQQRLRDYLRGGNADNRPPVFRESPADFADSTAKRRTWQAPSGTIDASIMPEQGSYLVDVNDPYLPPGTGGVVLAKIRIEQGSAPYPLVGLAPGDSGYWFVERDTPPSNAVRSYFVRASDALSVQRRFGLCHRRRWWQRRPSAPKADFYECTAVQRAAAVRQQGVAGPKAQRELAPWDGCPSGCCMGF